MTKRVISTEKAPKAIGPYSQAIAVSPTELVYCSGQIPLDPATGQVVDGGIDEQTKRVLDNIEAVLSDIPPGAIKTGALGSAAITPSTTHCADQNRTPQLWV